MAKRQQLDDSLLSTALAGLEFEKQRIENAMAQIRAELGQRSSATESRAAAKGPAGRHGMSAEGRARIAAAQRKRWAALKASGAPPAPRRRRKLSAEGKARIAAATKARWEAYRKAKAKTKA